MPEQSQLPPFDGTTLVPGRIVGIRAFGLREDGVLTGLTNHGGHYGYAHPGVNNASCLLGPLERIFSHALSCGTVFRPPAAEERGIDRTFTHDHVPAQLHCTCGFYAYYTVDDAPYTKKGLVGIVAGTGRITAGSKGFRAQRAEILGVVIPHPFDVADRWSIACYVVATGSLILSALRNAATLTFTPNWPSAALVALHTLLATFGASQLHRFWRARNDRDTIPGHWVYVERLITDRYPDLPIYRTVDEALHKHPLSVQPTVQP